MDENNHGAAPNSKGKGKEVPAASSSAPKHGDSISTQVQDSSGSDGSLIGRITTSAVALSRAALSSQSEHLSGLGSGKATSETTSARKLAEKAGTVAYRRGTGSGSGVESAFAHQRHSATAEGAEYNDFLGVQASLDELQSLEPAQPESYLCHLHGASSAVTQQETRDGQQVTDLLNTPGELEVVEEIGESLRPFLSSHEVSELREALFGHNGEKVNSNWGALLDFEPDLFQGNNSPEIQQHFGDVEPQRAMELWMDSWNEVVTSYTDEVWGDLGSLAHEAQREVREARELGREQGTGDMKSLQRLRQILTHVRGSGH